MEAVAETTPLIAIKCAMVMFSLCSNVATGLLTDCTDRYDKEQTSLLTSLEARWLAPAPA